VLFAALSGTAMQQARALLDAEARVIDVAVQCRTHDVAIRKNGDASHWHT
jgi:hypothetical protein